MITCVADGVQYILDVLRTLGAQCFQPECEKICTVLIFAVKHHISCAPKSIP